MWQFAAAKVQDNSEYFFYILALLQNIFLHDELKIKYDNIKL